MNDHNIYMGIVKQNCDSVSLHAKYINIHVNPCMLSSDHALGASAARPIIDRLAARRHRVFMKAAQQTCVGLIACLHRCCRGHGDRLFGKLVRLLPPLVVNDVNEAAITMHMREG